MKKFLGALLALCLCLGLAGCSMKTPETVGTVGDVNIPGGLYLLMQYNAFTTVAAKTDADTTDVKAVLKSTVTDADGVANLASDLVAEETLKNIESYAAVETRYAELGGELTESDQATIDSYTDSMWSYYEASYTKNGIGKESLRLSVTNDYKNQQLMEMTYGKGGPDAVSDADLTSYLNGCVAGNAISLPLYNSSTYTLADTETSDAIGKLADTAAQSIRDGSTPAEAGVVALTASSTLLGTSFDASGVNSYVGAQIFYPTDFDQYADADGNNTVKDTLTALKPGEVGVVNMGMSYLVLQRENALDVYTLDDIRADALSQMKSDELKASLEELGSTLPRALSDSAIKAYPASKIKK